MLRFLTIRRLAVIDSVAVEFDPGLNVLTGETGAGKSILVEAVGLLLGGRASGDLVRTGEDTATVEAIFEVAGEEWLVRREITSQGRSRAFINGDLTTAGALRELAGRLIELHGQHEHQTLLDPATHLALLDAFAGLDARRAEVAAAHQAVLEARAEEARVSRALQDRDTRHELAAFQLAELDKAGLRPSEDEELATTRQVLASAERIQRLCTEAYGLLYEQDGAVLAGLGGVWRRLGELSDIDPAFKPYLDAREGIKSQLEDLALFLRQYGDDVDASSSKLQEVETRLALIERLKRKHGPTLADVITRRESLRRELAGLEDAQAQLGQATRAREGAAAGYLALATALSNDRRAAAVPFSRKLESLLGDLAMGTTQFEIRFQPPVSEEAWAADGVDRAEFYLSPNPGEELRPLARIVSGGELSRVMLALKTLAATARFGLSDAANRAPSGGAPGMIFDEVDAGIGGRVADIVGRKLRALGSAFQVLCITHLPQIAAYADTHFLIEKRVEEGRTRTTVTRLNEQGRVDELGRMLGGTMITEGLRRTAAEMLSVRSEARHPGSTATGESESQAGAKAKVARGNQRRRTER